MFVDVIDIKIQAGDGGNGVKSFRRERYVDRGGPDGGNGGNGGDVVFVGDHNKNNLAPFRQQRHVRAEDGRPGGKRQMHGASGKDAVVHVPLGTVVKIDGEAVADITTNGQQEIIARGGKGGFGNAHFKSSTRQAPQIAEIGEPGEAFDITLELKMIADIGVIGLPNAGKSTFLSVVTNAKPDIASYPFTTLTPNLGVADIHGESLLIADVPGLIEGAAEGKGLGDEFLRHVERSKVLLHLIDATSEDVVKDYQTIRTELKDYQIDLSDRPVVVALSKIELQDDDELDEKKAQLSELVENVYLLSAQAHQGIEEVLAELLKAVQAYVPEEVEEAEQTATVDEPAWQVGRIDSGYEIVGEVIERFARKTDFSDRFAYERFIDILQKKGVAQELEKLGIDEDDTVHIAGKEFTWE